MAVSWPVGDGGHAASFCLRDGSSLHPPDAGVYQTEMQHVPDDGNYY